MFNREDYGNKKLIKRIKDEKYKDLVISNGFCVALLDFSEAVIEKEITKYSDSVRYIKRTIKITEYLGLYKHTWSGKSVEITDCFADVDTSEIDFDFKLTKSLKLDKHTLDGKAIKKLDISLGNCFAGRRKLDIEIRTCDKWDEPGEKIRLQYNNKTKDFETMIWHRFWQEENDELPAEFWVRQENNSGEIYLDINPTIKKAFSMMQ